jgi:hypothetical protein
MMSVAKRIGKDRERLVSYRARRGGSVALALDDLAAPLGRRRRHGMIRMQFLSSPAITTTKLDLDRRSSRWPREGSHASLGGHEEARQFGKALDIHSELRRRVAAPHDDDIVIDDQSSGCEAIGRRVERGDHEVEFGSRKKV